jgi:hypothetical protein
MMPTIDFYYDIQDIYGLYLHSRMGLLKFCEEHQKASIVNPQNRFSFVDSVEELRDGKFTYSSTFGEIYELNSPNGVNMRLLSNMVIVNIYQLWDEHYREKISKKLGLNNKSDLKIDLFGELNTLRQAIIHNNGQVISKLKQLKILKYSEVEGYLFLDYDDIKYLMQMMTTEIINIEQRINNHAVSDSHI